MKSWRSDPVLIKPTLFDFLTTWNDNTKKSSSISFHVQYTIDEFKTTIPTNLPPNEQRRFERKLEMKLHRQQTLFIANTKDSLSEPLRRQASLPELSLLPSNFSFKRVSFLFKEDCSFWLPSLKRSSQISQPEWTLYSPKPILVRKPRCSSLPLCHMDFDSFNAWRRGSQISEELYQTNAAVAQRLRKKFKDAENSDIWTRTCEFLKSFLFHCKSQNRTQPQEVIYSDDYKQ